MLSRFISEPWLPPRGTSSGVTGFTTPRYPSVFSPFVFSSPLVFAFSFLPSRVGDGALHEKLLPLCLLPRFSWTADYPRVLAVRGDPLDGWCTVGPRCINSAGILTFWLVC
ncbi:hypothetical protein AVEN_270892-1 [Araneus ventricosus]|uniref:Uncharacterized protein n=1 Tax=Araneus ventricosus TaxID=182803 RepID=A0A4Y2DFB8_ARAVE|nr:hypothetical protein AVEN_270892-1 [Araneus ventricosus]